MGWYYGESALPVLTRPETAQEKWPGRFPRTKTNF